MGWWPQCAITALKFRAGIENGAADVWCTSCWCSCKLIKSGCLMSRGEAGQYVQGVFQTLQRSGTDPWIYKLLAKAGSCFQIPLLTEHHPIWVVSDLRREHCNWGSCIRVVSWYAIAWQAVTACTHWVRSELARLDAARADPTSPLQLSTGLKWEHSMRNVEKWRQIQYDKGTNCDIYARKKHAQSQNKNLPGLL